MRCGVNKKPGRRWRRAQLAVSHFARISRFRKSARIIAKIIMNAAALAARLVARKTRVHGRLAWAHDWVSDPTLAAVFQALPGASFIVNGAAPAKDSALVSAGTELRLANNIALLAKFDGEFANRSQTYAGTGTLRYTW
jgi:hypothetical protein